MSLLIDRSIVSHTVGVYIANKKDMTIDLKKSCEKSVKKMAQGEADAKHNCAGNQQSKQGERV